MHNVRGLPLAIAIAAAALAAPAGALAQTGAADQQYADPFARNPTGQGGAHSHPTRPQPTRHTGASSNGTDTSSGSAPSATPSAPVQTKTGQASSSTAAVSPTTTSASSGAAANAATLPRTGSDSVVEALAGAGLLLTGFGLRARLRRTAGPRA